MWFSKDYTAVCYRILNKNCGVGRVLGDHPVIDLTESYFFSFLKMMKKHVQLLKSYLSKNFEK